MDTLIFDLDGTIVDLFHVKHWLKDLRAENTAPYKEASPIYNMNELNKIIQELKQKYKIIVVTWTSKGGSKEYNKEVKKAKKEWLEKYDFPFDEIHCIKYGTTKANAVRRYGKNQILFDDNEKVRKGWKLGKTVDAKENILPVLKELI